MDKQIILDVINEEMIPEFFGIHATEEGYEKREPYVLYYSVPSTTELTADDAEETVGIPENLSSIDGMKQFFERFTRESIQSGAVSVMIGEVIKDGFSEYGDIDVSDIIIDSINAALENLTFHVTVRDEHWTKEKGINRVETLFKERREYYDRFMEERSTRLEEEES